MDNNMKPKLITKWGVVVDLTLTVIFFAWMTTVLEKHVPWGGEASPTAVLVGALLCSACLSGVLWMALNLFRVTLADQMLPKDASDKQGR